MPVGIQHSSNYNNLKAIEDHNIDLRRAIKSDFPGIKLLFSECIKKTCTRDYNLRQRNAWISSIKDSQRWYNKINDQYFILAFIQGELAGMCSLENNNYLDLLFIHPSFQSQSLASYLYKKIEIEAKKSRGKRLKLHSSLTAKTFFQKMGFEVNQKSYSLKNGEKLHYFVMTKEL